MSQKQNSLSKNSRKKYVFTLKGVNTEKVDQRFGITIISNINISDKQPQNTTNLSDLSANKNTPEIISFLDEAKKSHKCVVSMVDFHTGKGFDGKIDYSIYDCFWCRHSIPVNILAIGCPIKYIPNQAIKTYHSEISKDTYTIKEDITTERIRLLMDLKDNQVTAIKRGYYLTDGIFCSFNCCMAFIDDNKHNSMYSLSEMLLLKMYNDFYPGSVPFIEKAAHWRKLIRYTGDLTIEQFRDSFNKIVYQPHGYVAEPPRFRSLGILFEEKLKF